MTQLSRGCALMLAGALGAALVTTPPVAAQQQAPLPPGSPLIGRPDTDAAKRLAPVAPPPIPATADKFPIDKLKAPLKAIPDDTKQGGTPGHFAIAPVDEKGEVDVKQLEAWAMSRGTGETHELTQKLLDAVVKLQRKIRGAPLVKRSA